MMMGRRSVFVDRTEGQTFVPACLNDPGQGIHCRFVAGRIMHENDVVTVFQSVFYVLYQKTGVRISAGSVSRIYIPVEVLNILIIQELYHFRHRHFPRGQRIAAASRKAVEKRTGSGNLREQIGYLERA